MITESTFVHAENLPEEMRIRLDQPWHFVGEIPPRDAERYGYQRVVCTKCQEKERLKLLIDFKNQHYPDSYTFSSVDLKRYLFVTDDMIEVLVFFGVCQKCQAVHWARSGPPFRRARALVPIGEPE